MRASPRVRAWVLALAIGPFAVAHGGQAAGDTLAQIDAIGRSLAAQKCRRPVEVKTVFVANPRDRGVADEMQSFDCKAFRVAIYRSLFPTPAHELPMSVVLVEAHPLAEGPWSLGASADSISAMLGPPARRFGDSLVYSTNPAQPGRNTITFEVSAGVVRALSWNWEVD
jgi:hypothetical protein